MADFNTATFRANFPEFADTVKYPDASITFWAGLGAKLLNATRWNALGFYDEGLQLFVAHNITLQAQNVAAVAGGDAPGTSSGLLSSVSAGSVSASIDTQAGIEDKGGNYNLTTYGTQYLRLARIVGIGGAQV